MIPLLPQRFFLEFLPKAKPVTRTPQEVSGALLWRQSRPPPALPPQRQLPMLGSAPLQPWLSRIAAPQGGRSTLGMSCWEQPAGLGSAAAAVSQTQGLASARPARGSNHPANAPWAFHRERHGHTEIPNSNRDSGCYRQRAAD